jgi:hypothetical protein
MVFSEELGSLELPPSQIAQLPSQCSSRKHPEHGEGTGVEAGTSQFLDVHLQFTSTFNSSYVRNNKSKAKKHVRCFPRCCAAGHSDTQFCGESVGVKVTSNEISSEELKSLHIFGCFISHKDAPICNVGQTLSKSGLSSLVQAKHMISGSPLEICGVFSGTFDLSSNNGALGLNGWNYLNSTNQTRGQTCHAFQAFCFVPSGPGFLCVAMIFSSPFQISSTKRKKAKPACMMSTEPAKTKAKRLRTAPIRNSSSLKPVASNPVGGLNPPETNPKDQQHQCEGMDLTLRACFDKMALEREMLEEYLPLVMDDGVATGAPHTSVGRSSVARYAPPPLSPAEADADVAACNPPQLSTLRLLFECVYLPPGVYNQLFRQQVQDLRSILAEQLRIAKQIHGTATLVSISSTDAHRSHQDLKQQVLEPFVELAGQQTARLCVLHSEELSRWLTSAYDGFPPNRSDPISAMENDLGDGLIGSSQSVLQSIQPILNPAIVSCLNHIGRIEPELAFLAKLAEIGGSCEAEAQSSHDTDFAAQTDTSSFGNFIARCTNASSSSSSSSYRSNHAAILGSWQFSDRISHEEFEECLVKIGYPWFIRQFLKSGLSMQTFTDIPNQGLMSTPNGRVLGFRMQGSHKDQSVVFRRQVLHIVDIITSRALAA